MSAAATFLNFAYGSNMLTQRLRERVPSARLVGAAVLDGHVLHWHKVSQDGSGKCDVVQTSAPQGAVLGVVYEILQSEKAALDTAEGLGNGYAEKLVRLEAATGQLQALAYYATHVDPAAVPYTWYKALVVAGARQHCFPEPYVARLEAVAAKVDSDTKRAERHFAIAMAGEPDGQHRPPGLLGLAASGGPVPPPWAP